MKNPRRNKRRAHNARGKGDLSSKLDALVALAFDAEVVPGLAVGLSLKGTFELKRAYGVRDPETQSPMREDSIFQLASLSKLFTATAVLKLVDQKKLDLDASIHPLLPFECRPPSFPNTPITPRMLLTHTSSIQDNWDVISQYYVYGEDNPMGLGEFLESYLSPHGEDFDLTLNYFKHRPATHYEYSNIGFALLGFLVEQITHTDFAEWCQEELFRPLGMFDTTWRISEIPQTRIAFPTTCDEDDEPCKLQLYSTPDYPDGQLCSTLEDLNRFVSGLFGWSGQTPILSEAQRAQMFTPQIPDLDEGQALGWYWESEDGQHRIGHAGNEQGITTALWLSPEREKVLLILMNGDEDEEPLSEELVDLLMSE